MTFQQMEAAYLQNRMLFHPRNVTPHYQFPWYFALAPLISSASWVSWSAAVLMLAMIIGAALRKVSVTIKLASTMTPSVPGAKRLAKQAIAEYMIVDTKKGSDGDEGSRDSSQPLVEERAFFSFFGSHPRRRLAP